MSATANEVLMEARGVGKRFGACVDRFGTSWMVSVDHPEAAAE